MEESTVPEFNISTIEPSCLDSNSNITGCLTENVKEWLENEVGGMRLWQLGGIVLSVIFALTIMICCCVRFRIPRTKQEIEADYIRKKLTRKFRRELGKFSDKEMDDMDLRKALDRIRQVFDDIETDEAQLQDKSKPTAVCGKQNKGIGTAFNAMFHGIRIRFSKDEAAGFNAMI